MLARLVLQLEPLPCAGLHGNVLDAHEARECQEPWKNRLVHVIFLRVDVEPMMVIRG